MKKTRRLTKAKSSTPSVKKIDLLEDLRNMVDQAKRSVASVVNTHLENDTICRVVSRGTNSRDTVARIELEPFC